MFGWAKAAWVGLNIVDKALAIWRFIQGRQHDEEQREFGRNEQKVADQNEVIRQGHEGNAIDEEVGRLSDDELNKRLRKRARPKRS